MNIFFLDGSPERAAAYHCDKHVVKMILETGQLLDTAHGAQAWRNHPCAVWARASLQNYRWLARLGVALLNEYRVRYGKIHSYALKLKRLQAEEPELPDVGLTGPPIVVPDDCLIGRDLIASYRKYYKVHKAHFARWRTDIPDWFKEEL